MAAAAYDVAMDYLYKYAPGVAEQLVISNATTTKEQLYGDIALSSLNWFERLWANYYIYMGNAILATGVMSFVLHEVSVVVAWRGAASASTRTELPHSVDPSSSA